MDLGDNHLVFAIFDNLPSFDIKSDNQIFGIQNNYLKILALDKH